jgi:hypothetical protein
MWLLLSARNIVEFAIRILSEKYFYGNKRCHSLRKLHVKKIRVFSD